MPRRSHVLTPGLFALFCLGCGVEELEAIIAMYDTFGSTDSSGSSSTTGGDTDTSTTAALGTDTSTTTSPDEASGTAGLTGTASSSDTGASSSTTAPAPVCGDGIQDGDEECDDGNRNDADACFNNCTRVWLVFITSDPGTQGDIQGLTGADYQCRHRATKMFLPNGERYMAWISTSQVQPADRFYHARGPYRLVNGLQVAADWDALVSGQLENPIIVDEMSHTNDSLVFTGTNSDGTRMPGSTHCNDWTTKSGNLTYWFGASEATNGDWTRAAETDCGAGAALYCFEQP
jgi:cysteine-rich repeat protein